MRVPAVDWCEGKKEEVLKTEVPSLSKENLKIDLTDSMLTISGEKKKEEGIEEEDYTYSERAYGSFSRSRQWPCAVKDEKVKATFKDGILEVRLPKTEDVQKRHVSVKIE
ncbi:MAG: Hsp20/alpha crystallin family protein [Nitrospirales bacterium]|nr:Hsp20/alpha crystallin family protein [Nitrospirales bacterium]